MNPISGLNDRKRLSEYPNKMAMVGEMIWATIDLSDINFYRFEAAYDRYLVLNECKLERLFQFLKVSLIKSF